MVDLVDEQGHVRRRHLAADEHRAVHDEEPAHDRVRHDTANGSESEPNGATGRNLLGTDLLRTERQQDRHAHRESRGQGEDGGAGGMKAVDHDSSESRSGAKPEHAAGGEDTERQAQPATRRDVTDGGHHHAAVAELEPHQQHSNHELPGRPAGRDYSKHDRLNKSATDDHGLAAVLVGPHAPQRDDREAGQEEERPQ